MMQMQGRESDHGRRNELLGRADDCRRQRAHTPFGPPSLYAQHVNGGLIKNRLRNCSASGIQRAELKINEVCAD